MNKSQNKSHLRRNIAIAIITVLLIAIIVLLLSIIAYVAYNLYYHSSRPNIHTFTQSGTIKIPPLPYEYLKINVPSGTKNILLSISFTASGGIGNDIYCYVMDQTNFINWKNGHQAHAIYNSGQVTTANTSISLPGPGVYYVVFDNTFSLLFSKTVNYSIKLSYYTSS
jgi:hypothetical protein